MLQNEDYLQLLACGYSFYLLLRSFSVGAFLRRWLQVAIVASRTEQYWK